MNVLKPHLQTTIWTLLKGGATQREIERITGISRHTIRSYQQRFAADPANCPGVATDSPSQTAPPWPPTGLPVSPPVATSRCEPHRTFIDAQLRLGRNATAIYQDLVDLHGFDGAYNSVKRFVAQLRHKEPEQFDRLSFAPGEEMQVDYGEGAPTRVPGTERWRKPRLFVATLRYSRRSFRRVVWNSGQQIWAELHEQAWRYFGGSARYVVLDNLKEGVLKPDLYEPALNPVYAATLAHYEVVADPARVRDPNRKGTVENAIGHTQATALKGRRFETIEEQNAFLEHWESKWAASRIHGAERRQVQAMFEEERAHLQPLPLTGMQYFTEVQRSVCDDSCVRIDHSSYAARPAVIGTKVLVRIFERRIEIRDLRTQALLRTHARVERPGTVVLPLAERVFNPSRETRFILGQARAIGPQAARLCEMLFAIEGRVGQRKLWGIVNLARRYPHRFIDAACAGAMEQGVHSYRHVKALTERFVADALAALEAASPAPSASASTLTQQHALIRSADEYGDLFAHVATATQSSENTQP
ncbi:MAG: IS21 family transposase [Hydrogenophaga sp.]|uniref:IS21 family transposase n=1 Tax=Hydrogenophaga sp. TaxID=1904254 RepID=UPI002603D49C|nr:IS21 family transposase [Hydrogenophaga sp.]MDD3787048.1 IS21 family transposase [Hydrogenophaga sp.]MDX9970156.1 IS21 family transposase [Hydrogenophaga sp.]